MYILHTNLSYDIFIKRLKEITLPYEKVNFTQFKSKYKYKGQIEEKIFKLEDINIGYKGTSDIIKGRISIDEEQQVHITIEVENPGADMLRTVSYAIIYPFAIIVIILLFIFNEETLANIEMLCAAVILSILFRPKKASDRNIQVTDKLRQDLLITGILTDITKQ